MVPTTNSMQTFFHPGQLSVDTSSRFNHTDEDDFLDDTVFDHTVLDSGLEMSPPMGATRRESFYNPLFSPKQESDWTPADMQSLPAGNYELHRNNPFFDYINRSSQQTQPAQHSPQQMLGSHIGAWPMTASNSAASASVTPVVPLDGLHAEFETPLFQRAPQPNYTLGGNIYGSVMPGLPTLAVAGHGTTGADAALMQYGISHAGVDPNTVPKKMPPTSPIIRSHNELHRGDGIRKKNARFEIPAERNLNNIDRLIQLSTDEQEIKELKQQKRLLRNRQAALDSRQRKKLHTERLEDEKKHYTGVISELEQALERMKLQINDMHQEKQMYEQHIAGLNLDKEDMIRSHTLETNELRKKNAALTQHIQDLENAATASANMPSHPVAYAGAGAGMVPPGMGPYSAMAGLNMDAASAESWENLFPGITVEDQHLPVAKSEEQPATEANSEMQLATVHKTNGVETTLQSTEKSGSPGSLLFFMFLVGAFVMSSRHPPSFPPASEEMRQASATLLDSVFKDAGVSQHMLGFDFVSSALAPAASATANEPMASGSAAWAQASINMGMMPSSLGQLSDRLVHPTVEQANEQLFSLSAAQYNGVVDMQDSPSDSSDTAHAYQGRRNLAEALASMKSDSKAEVFTRSLLWDQIPGDVVRSFAKMMAEANAGSPRPDIDN